MLLLEVRQLSAAVLLANKLAPAVRCADKFRLDLCHSRAAFLVAELFISHHLDARVDSHHEDASWRVFSKIRSLSYFNMHALLLELEVVGISTSTVVRRREGGGLPSGPKTVRPICIT